MLKVRVKVINPETITKLKESGNFPLTEDLILEVYQSIQWKDDWVTTDGRFLLNKHHCQVIEDVKEPLQTPTGSNGLMCALSIMGQEFHIPNTICIHKCGKDNINCLTTCSKQEFKDWYPNEYKKHFKDCVITLNEMHDGRWFCPEEGRLYKGNPNVGFAPGPFVEAWKEKMDEKPLSTSMSEEIRKKVTSKDFVNGGTPPNGYNPLTTDSGKRVGVITVTDIHGDKYEYYTFKEKPIKILEQWFHRYGRSIQNPQGLLIDECSAVDMGDWYLTSNGTHIDKNHCYTDEEFRSLGRKETEEPINGGKNLGIPIFEEAGKIPPVDSNLSHEEFMDIPFDEREKYLDKLLAEYNEAQLRFIRNGGKFVSLTNKGDNYYPSENEVAEWIKMHDENISYDQNTKLAIFAFYYWIKSQRN